MRAKPSRLLVVDDEIYNRVVLSCGLKHRGYSVDEADGGPEALDKILREPYDLVLLDEKMPGMTGLALLRLLRATYSQTELPVIMVTGLEQNQIMMSALDQGANDFVLKPVEMPLITARIETQLSRAKADREIRESEIRYSPADLESGDTCDPLTGLSNRLTLLDRIAKGLAGVHGAGTLQVALLLLDLDGFKAINCSLGHAAADQLLVEVAARLRGMVAASRFSTAATVARLREDEFVVLIEVPNDAEEAIAFASVALDSLKFPVSISGLPVTVSAGVGVVLSEPETSASQLLRDADLAMDRAKAQGKNRLHLFDPGLRARARTRMATAIDLRHAVKRDELLAVYQPKMNLRTKTIAGFEALLRWQHPERGLLEPGDFISVAEETGLITSIGEWILEQACAQSKAWQDRFPASPPLTMSVNLSVKQLAGPNLLDTIRRILAESDIAPETLKLELTESTFMNEVESARKTLSEIRNLRVGLKLDDFGTGYSSLSYLSTTHFDALKIDKSFVDRLATDAESRAIVKTIVNLAGALNMGVVAEGIETEAQLNQLIALGCESGQGYLFSRPVAAEAAEQLLIRAAAQPWDRCEPHAEPVRIRQ